METVGIDNRRFDFLVENKDEESAVLKDNDGVERLRIAIVVWPSSNFYEFNSHISIFERIQKKESEIENGKLVKYAWEDLQEIGYWWGKESLSHILSMLKKFYEKYQGRDSLEIGVGRNEFGKALIEMIEKSERRIKNKLYKEPESDKPGISFDSPAGLLEYLIKMLRGDKITFLSEKGDEISKMLREAIGPGGIPNVPKKHEAYIYALAGACKIAKPRHKLLPLTVPTAKRIY